jgi:AcrB/AcrD/AcrF family
MVLAGVIAYGFLPVAQLPEVTPPQVVGAPPIRARVPRWSRNTVTTPLEEQIDGVKGMAYMSSVSANDGSATGPIDIGLGGGAAFDEAGDGRRHVFRLLAWDAGILDGVCQGQAVAHEVACGSVTMVMLLALPFPAKAAMARFNATGRHRLRCARRGHRKIHLSEPLHGAFDHRARLAQHCRRQV